MLWFCVELPDLGLDVCARRIPGEAVPAVLLQDNHVVARNSAAESAGIALGSSLATAHSICRGLVHFCRDIASEQERLRFLADAAYRFSASVSIHEPSAILLEVSGSLKLFGGVYGLKRRLINLLVELGHRADIGIAHTPLAALALARAKLQYELQREPSADDVRILTLKALRRIALRHTECEADVIERFANMGIETLGQVYGLPTAELARRFGPKLLDYLARLSGQRPDPRICITPATSFSAGLHFLESISNKEALAFPMQRLAQDQSNWLISRQLGVIRIGWRFVSFNGDAARMEVEFARPQQNKQSLLSISRLKLETLELPDEVLSIELSSIRLVAWQAESNFLFAKSEQARQAPTELIDQYKARLGNTGCHGIGVHDDHRPEFAWRPKTPNMPNAQVTAHRSQQSQILRRPIWLLEKPQPAPRHHLTLLRGPERIDVGWWVSADVHAPAQRDYFIARHANGSRCWVFSDEHEEWFVHGYFA
jgi:protein ImuB